MILFILSTGRAGTTTLCSILNAIPLVNCTHCHTDNELTWDVTTSSLYYLRSHVQLLYERMVNEPLLVNGNFTPNYLPYVNEIINELDFKCKFINLKRRSRKDVIKSYMYFDTHNYWQLNDRIPQGDFNLKPTYSSGLTKPEAIGRFYDEYNERCDILEELYPDIFRNFVSEDTIYDDNLSPIFSFLDLPSNTKWEIGKHLNANKNLSLDIGDF